MSDAELETRETFLRAIFDSPDDPTPRLIFADWLEERGDVDFSLLLRHRRVPEPNPKPHPPTRMVSYSHQFFLNYEEINRYKLPGYSWPIFDISYFHDPGFEQYESLAEYFRHTFNTTHHTVGEVQQVRHLRVESVTREPLRFLTKSIRLDDGIIVDDSSFHNLMAYPAMRHVIALDLCATIRPINPSTGFLIADNPNEYTLEPVITTAGVMSLARHRICRSLTQLDLRNNDLGNDAARAIARSPYLDNLKSLQLMEGNRIRGRVWQEVVERFGEDVVS